MRTLDGPVSFLSFPLEVHHGQKRTQNHTGTPVHFLAKWIVNDGWVWCLIRLPSVPRWGREAERLSVHWASRPSQLSAHLMYTLNWSFEGCMCVCYCLCQSAGLYVLIVLKTLSFKNMVITLSLSLSKSWYKINWLSSHWESLTASVTRSQFSLTRPGTRPCLDVHMCRLSASPSLLHAPAFSPYTARATPEAIDIDRFISTFMISFWEQAEGIMGVLVVFLVKEIDS